MLYVKTKAVKFASFRFTDRSTEGVRVRVRVNKQKNLILTTQHTHSQDRANISMNFSASRLASKRSLCEEWKRLIAVRSNSAIVSQQSGAKVSDRTRNGTSGLPLSERVLYQLSYQDTSSLRHMIHKYCWIITGGGLADPLLNNFTHLFISNERKLKICIGINRFLKVDENLFS